MEKFCLAEAHSALPMECKLRIVGFALLNEVARTRRRALEIHFTPPESQGFMPPFMPKKASGRLPIRSQADWASDLADSARVGLGGVRNQRHGTQRFEDPFVKSTTTA
jgi:hypothetical protein